MSNEPPPIGGTVEPGFEPVRDAFEANFEKRNELGAACGVYYQGRKVVDIWGGYRDAERTKLWTRDTLVLLFSTTKGVTATAMAHAHAQKSFEYDDRVAEHWASFGQAGKADVTIRELLGHRAGVAAIDGTLTPSDIADRKALIDRLTAKRPDWTPGSRQGYHAWSLGWYENELLRRTDRAGRSVATYLGEEVFEPLDSEFYIGLPESVPTDRVAEIKSFGAPDLVGALGSFPIRLGLALAIPWLTASRAMNPFDVSTPAELNDPEWRRLAIPAGNGIGLVRDLARLYGDLATGGEGIGLDRATIEELIAPAETPPGGPMDVVLKTETAYSLGYWKPFEGFRFGSSAAFGAPGAGGSFAFADPERELGFAYAPNRMGAHLWDDPREKALREAVIRCIESN